MPYLSFLERRAIAIGEARGEARGIARLLRDLLEDRFGPLPQAITERLESADADRAIVWGRRIFRAPTLDAVMSDDPPESEGTD